MNTIDDRSKLIREVRTWVGDELILHTLGREQSEELDVDHLDPAELESITVLCSILEQYRLMASQQNLPLSLVLSSVNTPIEQDVILNTVLRLREEELPNGEDFGSRLSRVARRAFVHYLIVSGQRSQDSVHSWGLFPPIEHREQVILARDLMEDPRMSPLADLVDSETDPLMTSVWLSESIGSGGSVQPIMLPGTILQNAYLIYRMRGLRGYTGYRQCVDEALGLLFTAVTGKAQAPVLLVHCGISLEQVGVQNFGKLWLRPWDYHLDTLVPAEARPSQIISENQPVRLGFLSSLELEVTYEMSASAPSLEDPDIDLWPHFRELHRKLDKQTHQLALSAFLALDAERAAGIKESMRLIMSPFRFGGFSFDEQSSQLSSAVADDRSVKQWLSWFETVSTTDARAVEVGLDRLIKAVVHRKDPIDAIIDAVISWEALLGDPQGELRFRISTAMAAILAKNEETRKELAKEVKYLYDLRSQIVHGGKHPSSQEAMEKSKRILELSRSLMREAYTSYPKLLQRQLSAVDILLASPYDTD